MIEIIISDFSHWKDVLFEESQKYLLVLVIIYEACSYFHKLKKHFFTLFLTKIVFFSPFGTNFSLLKMICLLIKFCVAHIKKKN